MLHEISADLLTAEATLRHWEQTFPGIIRAEATAKYAYEVAWAEAIKKITDTVPEGQKQPTVAVLEAEATRICAVVIKAKREAEAEAEIAKKLIGIADTTLSSIQTRAKIDLAEMSLK